MHEAHVENLMLVDMVERVLPVAVVQMGVAAEHLPHHALTILVESLRKPARLADPVLIWIRGGLVGSVAAGEGHRGRCVQVGRGSWEHDGIVYLAHDPLLDAIDEFRGRDLGRFSVNKPRVSESGGAARKRSAEVSYCYCEKE